MIKAQFTYRIFTEIAKLNNMNLSCQKYFEKILQCVCEFTEYKFASAIMLKKNDHLAYFHFPFGYISMVNEADYPFITEHYKNRIKKGEVEIYNSTGYCLTKNNRNTSWAKIMIRYSMKAQISIPLIKEEDVLGLLIVSDDEEKLFSKEEYEFFCFIGALISAALSGEIQSCEQAQPYEVIDNIIRLKSTRKQIDFSNDYPNLKEEYKKSLGRKALNRQLITSRTINTLARMLEIRDYITEGHSDRLQNLLCIFGQQVGFTKKQLDNLQLLGKFHDIGKAGVRDSILLKPGKLTKEERAEMQRHCEIGCNIAKASQELEHISDLILKHHEWWNGQGYPLGISGEEIPLESRMLAIADAYDAMINDRPYRKALNHNQAITEIFRCSGEQFDPRLVGVFIQLFEIRSDRETNKSYKKFEMIQ